MIANQEIEYPEEDQEPNIPPMLLTTETMAKNDPDPIKDRQKPVSLTNVKPVPSNENCNH